MLQDRVLNCHTQSISGGTGTSAKELEGDNGVQSNGLESGGCSHKHVCVYLACLLLATYYLRIVYTFLFNKADENNEGAYEQ